MSKNVIIVECNSTGLNYLYALKRRGCHAIVLHVKADTEYKKFRDQNIKLYPKNTEIIHEQDTYKKTLELVKKFHPMLIINGGEAGIELGTHLSHDLHLRGNDYKDIDIHLRKDAMHEALKKSGIRYIRGKNVFNVKDAISFYRELKHKNVVLKPPRGAGAQSVVVCKNEEEVKKEATKFFASENFFGGKNQELLIQEQIIGDEYAVNTMSIDGNHRLISIWRYTIAITDEGKYIFSKYESINSLEAGNARLINYAYDVLDAVHFKNGPAHGEFMVDENGPVLLEVNARIMGGNFIANFSNEVYGQHDADEIIDDFLFPNEFKNKMQRPLLSYKTGADIKLIIPKEKIDVKSLPILSITKRLRSLHSICYKHNDHPLLVRTIDLETAGGFMFLLHENPSILHDDYDLIRLIEKNYINMFFEDKDSKNDDAYKHIIKNHSCLNVNDFLSACVKKGQTVILNDDKNIHCDYATIINLEDVSSCLDGYEIGIINLTKNYRHLSREEFVDKILTFMSKIRRSGIMYVLDTSFAALPYQSAGAEILLKAANYKIQSPIYKSNWLKAIKN